MEKCRCCCNCICHLETSSTSKIVHGNKTDYLISGTRITLLNDDPWDEISITPISHKHGRGAAVPIEFKYLHAIYFEALQIQKELDKI